MGKFDFLILGSASFGSRVTEMTAKSILKCYAARGYRSIDTANVYGAGHSLKIIQNFINDSEFSDFYITLKYGLKNDGNSLPSWFLNFVRPLMRLSVFKFIRKVFFKNRNVSYDIKLIALTFENGLSTFGANFKRFCFHDPSLEDVIFIFENLSELKDLCARYSVDLGLSISQSNSILLNSSYCSRFSELDFIQIDCNLAVSFNSFIHNRVFVFSAYRFFSTTSREVIARSLNVLGTEVSCIVDVKSCERLDNWVEFERSFTFGKD